MRPPLHPESCLSQSTNCCSLSETSLPLAISQAPSEEPVVENDQHEPHCPWFLTGVTAPLVVQSTASAKASPPYSCWPRLGKEPQGCSGCLMPKCVEANSSAVKSANWVTPSSKELPFAFISRM